MLSVVAFWATPMMTARHLRRDRRDEAILVALQFEERDLAALGDQYRDYRREVSMLHCRGRTIPESTGSTPLLCIS